jgi:hypothetical protein
MAGGGRPRAHDLKEVPSDSVPGRAHAAPGATDNAPVEPIVSSGAAHVFRPSSSSPELNLLLRDGRMLAAEVLSNPGDGTLMLAIGRHVVPADSDLRFDPGTTFLARVDEEPDGIVLRLLGDEGGEEPALLRALRGVVGEERPLGELFAELRAALALEEPPVTALARSLEAGAELPGSGPLLKALLLGSGLAHEALLAALARGRGPDPETLRGDLKALLLRALAELPEGPVRESARHALAGLEAEQLLNLARERMGEPLVLSVPIHDGHGWTTARFLVPPRRGKPEDEEATPFRMAVGVELSRLGPVRADLVLSPTSLVVRILVTRPELVAHLTAQVDALRERIGDGRRRVHVHVREATPADVHLGARPLDIRFLRENRLMNVAG